MTFTAIVWSKEQFVTWRCAACLLSRKDCSVMKKINSTNNAEQPRPPALNRWVALSAFDEPSELKSQAITLTLLLAYSFSPKVHKYLLGSPDLCLAKAYFIVRYINFIQ